MFLKCSVEVRCIVCARPFCCKNCRWSHENTVHNLKYDCDLCRGIKFLCDPKLLENKHFLKHIADEHLPLYCHKCDCQFTKMEDLVNIDKCCSISELINTETKEENNNVEANEVNDRFDSIYEKTVLNQNERDNFEAIVSINRSTKTAVITPVVRKKHIVDYDLSESESEASPLHKNVQTPYHFAPKTPKMQTFKRTATPHIKKFLMRQKAMETEEEDNEFDNCRRDMNKNSQEYEDTPGSNKKTPSRLNNDHRDDDMTTPTSHVINERCVKVTSSAVTTSTPTHPIASTSGWSLFPGHGADSPLSEIEGTNTDSPAQSVDNEPTKSEISENILPKLKSIMSTINKTKIESQDSSEKQVTFADSTNCNESSSECKPKKVKFAEDTIFQKEKRITRVFRKPKRMLTPGPQRPSKFCNNPRFQALINTFENQGRTMAQTPVISRDFIPENETPPLGNPTPCIQARAINFKEESPASTDISQEKGTPINDLFQSCFESPDCSTNLLINNAISTLTSNIAGSFEKCLNKDFQKNDEVTEIQFNIVITKRKVSVKTIVDNVEERKFTEIKRNVEEPDENIWSSLSRAVKSVFWKDNKRYSSTGTTTPLTRSWDSSNVNTSWGCKRKCEDMADSDISPINHKRKKHAGRITGRPSIHRIRNHRPVTNLRISRSAEQRTLLAEISETNDDNHNQSF